MEVVNPGQDPRHQVKGSGEDGESNEAIEDVVRVKIGRVGVLEICGNHQRRGESPTLDQQMIVIEIALAACDGDQEGGPADRGPVAGEDGPDTKERGHSAEVTLAGQEGAIHSGKEAVPFGAKVVSVEVEEHAAGKQ